MKAKKRNYCEADSCLIAAAPEMYEALRKITEEQECGRDCAKCTNHGCVIKECKAALAKASGEGEEDCRAMTGAEQDKGGRK